MKKHQLDHILRAAGDITGEKQFLVVGSQSLHATHPDLADLLVMSAEADLVATDNVDRTDWLNVIGQDSRFHETFGYYADPVEDKTSILPDGWRRRLVTLPPGDTNGVVGQCLDPHDLAIAKYVARREKDVLFNRKLAALGIVRQEMLLQLLIKTPVDERVRERIRSNIARDFDIPRPTT